MVVPFGNEWTKGKQLKDLNEKSLEWVINSNGKQDLKDAAKKVLESQKGKPKKSVERPTSQKPISSQSQSLVIKNQYPTEIAGTIQMGGDKEIVVNVTFMNLTESNGHIYSAEGRYGIQVDGYNHMNKVAGLYILKPPTVDVDGIKKGNPHIIRQMNPLAPGYGAVELAVARKIAFGRAPGSGNPVAIDQTISFAPYTYLIESLLKLVDKSPTVAQLRTVSSLDPDEKKNQKRYVIDENLCILIKDMSSPEYLKALKNHSTNQKFGERKAVSICERNCMKKHPAIGINRVKLEGQGKDAYAVVPVFSFNESEHSRNELFKISEKVRKDEDIGTLNVDVREHFDEVKSEIEEAEITESVEETEEA